MDMDKIYNRIDSDESMTDEQKREEYMSQEEQELFSDSEFDLGN